MLKGEASLAYSTQLTLILCQLSLSLTVVQLAFSTNIGVH